MSISTLQTSLKKIFTSKKAKIAGITVVCVFAVIGLVFSGVFVAMQFGWLNVRGASTSRNTSFGRALGTSFGAVPKSKKSTPAAEQKGSICLPDSTGTSPKQCSWYKTLEWQTVSGGLTKDADTINKVAQQVGVSPRMIAAAVVPEQLRYFTSNRESFKRYFEPLKILSAMSKFSLGVSGIKQETATLIEQYANDPTSDFYPGDGMAALIAYQNGANHDTQLFDRLTDSKNHYYSYLYTALYLKEITMQWQKAGYDVSQRPDVLVTLFNIGFKASNPNPHPAMGGAVITVGDNQYNFGELGTLFYQSDELRTVFPQ